MSASGKRLVLTFVLVGLTTLAAAQSADQLAAARLFGPHWKRQARAVGMVFAGTVLTVEGPDQLEPVPAVHVKLRVDRAIVGVRPGQVLTIREWTGVSGMRAPIRSGQHLLFLLYPPSWLGLTSPVGGISGQILLDASGHIRQARQPDRGETKTGRPSVAGPPVTLSQLARAIRGAREE